MRPGCPTSGPPPSSTPWPRRSTARPPASRESRTPLRRLLSDLAHELLTPIATLSAFHEGLHDGVATLGPESRAVLAEQTDRLARLADNIDEVSTAEEGRLQLTLRSENLGDLLQAAHDEMRPRYASKGVHLAIDA
ncbi:MAG: hypothetical protein M3Y71_07840 [Actinomycetota bacterium]|nr:hypothetical protein [Actinomycetota bacterium]